MLGNFPFVTSQSLQPSQDILESQPEGQAVQLPPSQRSPARYQSYLQPLPSAICSLQPSQQTAQQFAFSSQQTLGAERRLLAPRRRLILPHNLKPPLGPPPAREQPHNQPFQLPSQVPGAVNNTPSPHLQLPHSAAALLRPSNQQLLLTPPLSGPEPTQQSHLLAASSQPGVALALPPQPPGLRGGTGGCAPAAQGGVGPLGSLCRSFSNAVSNRVPQKSESLKNASRTGAAASAAALLEKWTQKIAVDEATGEAVKKLEGLSSTCNGIQNSLAALSSTAEEHSLALQELKASCQSICGMLLTMAGGSQQRVGLQQLQTFPEQDLRSATEQPNKEEEAQATRAERDTTAAFSGDKIGEENWLPPSGRITVQPCKAVRGVICNTDKLNSLAPQQAGCGHGAGRSSRDTESSNRQQPLAEIEGHVVSAGGAGLSKDKSGKQTEVRQDTSAANGGSPKPKWFDRRDAPEVSLRTFSRAATSCSRRRLPRDAPNAGQNSATHRLGGKLHDAKAAGHGGVGVGQRSKTAELLKDKVGSKFAEQGAEQPLGIVPTAVWERAGGKADRRDLGQTDAWKAECVTDGKRIVDGKGAKGLEWNKESGKKRKGDSGARAADPGLPTDIPGDVGRKRARGSSRRPISVCALRKLAASGKLGSADGVTAPSPTDDSEIQRKIWRRLQRHQAKRLKAAER